MKTINITVRDKLPVVTAMSGSAVMDNKYKLLFDFDDEWQNGLKSIVVVGNRGQYVVYPTETDEVEIEFGDARNVSVGVIQDIVATSRPCHIIAEESIKRRMGVEIIPPAQDVWTYITEQIRLLNAAKLSPVDKTNAMTQPVGRDDEGRLWTEPGGGLNPVEKTDAMTAEVGRDEQGRLWAEESKKGVKSFGFGVTYHPDPSRPQGRYLGVGLEDGTTALVLIQELARELGIDKILSLPEYTDADEGKVLAVMDGAPVWSDAPAGGSVNVSYDDTTGDLTITSSSGGVVFDEATGNLEIGG